MCLKLNHYISVRSDPIWVVQEPFESPGHAILLHKWICDLVRWMSCWIHLRTSIKVQGGPEFPFQMYWPRSLQPVELSSWNLQAVGSICSQVTCQNLDDFALQIVQYMSFPQFAHLPGAKMGAKLKFDKNWWKMPFGSNFICRIQKSIQFFRKVNFSPWFRQSNICMGRIGVKN